MQTVALLAMEPPLGAGADALRDEKETLFRAIRTLEPGRHRARASSTGYRDEPGVAPDSDVETYAGRAAAHRLVALGRRALLHPRRQGAARSTAPRCASSCTARPRTCSPRPRRDAPRQQLPALPAEPARVTRDRRDGQEPRARRSTVAPSSCMLCNDSPGEMSAYERLLGDALDGESLLFAREDGVESAWRVVDRVLTDHGPAYPYDAGHVGSGRGRRARRTIPTVGTIRMPERFRSTRRRARNEESDARVPRSHPERAARRGRRTRPAVRAGDWVLLAGQVGVDPATGALVPGGVEAEADQVLTNLAAVLGRLRRRRGPTSPRSPSSWPARWSTSRR